MDLNLILGIILTVILLYICALVYSLWRLNRQITQAHQWNNFRDHIFTRAQEDQKRAERITSSIRNQYGDLGIPYPADRDRAFGVLIRISENVEAILVDRGQRSPISPNKNTSFWRVFLIRPLWAEYQNRQRWWEITQKLRSRLGMHHSDFLEVEKLLNELAAKGRHTRTDFEILQNKTGVLIRAFENERQTDIQFQDQIQQLRQLQQQISQTINQDLAGSDPAPKQVAVAASKLQTFQKEWDRLNAFLENKGKDPDNPRGNENV